MKYIGIDLGGTNLRISEVDPDTGELIGKTFKCSLAEKGIKTNEDLTALVTDHLPEECSLGISAAGDIDEKHLMIKGAPNSPIKGTITLAKDLASYFPKVVITNDMKAASQGAARFGEGKGYRRVLVATYSSGYNCAVVDNLTNVTQAEFGHMVYDPNSDLVCGCRGKGHLEIFVSGSGAAKIGKKELKKIRITSSTLNNHLVQRVAADLAEQNRTDLAEIIIYDHLAEKAIESVTARQIYETYRQFPDEEPQKSIRDTQLNAIASSFGMMVSAFNPIDMIILMGSMTNDWDVLFEPAIKQYHESEGRYQFHTLHKPQIVKTKMPEIGVQGAVAYLLGR